MRRAVTVICMQSLGVWEQCESHFSIGMFNMFSVERCPGSYVSVLFQFKTQLVKQSFALRQWYAMRAWLLQRCKWAKLYHLASSHCELLP